MSFGVLKFGEKCERHAAPAFRGQDNRSHIMGAPRVVPQALKLQSSGDWLKPLPKPGEEDESLKPKRPLTAAQRMALKQQQSSSCLANVLTKPNVTPTSSASHRSDAHDDDFSMGDSHDRPSTAGKKVHPQKSALSAVAVGVDSDAMAALPQPSLSRKQKDELQMTKNINAGMRMPTNLPLPVNMNEVISHVEQPKSIPPPPREVTGLQAMQDKMEFERRLDTHVTTIRKYIDVKSNFAPPQGQTMVLQRLMKSHCTTTGEMTPVDFATAMSVFNLNLTEEEQEGLFDRFDVNENGTVSFREMSDGILGRKQVAGASEEARKLLADIKIKILKRNPNDNAVRSFTRAFRLINKDKDAGLSSDELFNGLQKIGIRVKLPDVQKLVKFFDTSKDGKISQGEFLTALRGRMSVRRKKLVQKAYNILDENGDGDITLAEIGARYDTSKHPAVLSGEKTVEEVLGDFVDSWDQSGDDTVSWKEFLTYYKEVSSGIDLDDYFELMIRNAWHISGGSGVSANTANRRVLVIHTDGRQSVEEIKNDLGIGPKDIQKMRVQLEKQGIKDIKEIQVAG